MLCYSYANNIMLLYSGNKIYDFLYPVWLLPSLVYLWMNLIIAVRLIIQSTLCNLYKDWFNTFIILTIYSIRWKNIPLHSVWGGKSAKIIFHCTQRSHSHKSVQYFQYYLWMFTSRLWSLFVKTDWVCHVSLVQLLTWLHVSVLSNFWNTERWQNGSS